MKRAAIGVRMHSGWGAIVAVCGGHGEVEVVDRRRIAVTNPETPGALQPYHRAANLRLPEAERFLETCREVSERMAEEALREFTGELSARGYRVAGSAILLASGRPLPALPGILASHALIHTAEGEFFRDAVRRACAHLGITVTGFRERELEDRAKALLGKAAKRVLQTISTLGRTLGPPWTKDQKTAALAAMMVLAARE